MRRQEQKEQEAERLRDEKFNKYMPIIPQGKVQRVKIANHPARSVEPLWATGQTGTADRSDRPEQPVKPIEPSVQQKAESKVPVSAPCDEETSLVPSIQDYEELVDNEAMSRTLQCGAQQDFSTRGTKNRRMVIYLMKLLNRFARGSQSFDCVLRS